MIYLECTAWRIERVDASSRVMKERWIGKSDSIKTEMDKFTLWYIKNILCKIHQFLHRERDT